MLPHLVPTTRLPLPYATLCAPLPYTSTSPKPHHSIHPPSLPLPNRAPTGKSSASSHNPIYSMTPRAKPPAATDVTTQHIMSVERAPERAISSPPGAQPSAETNDQSCWALSCSCGRLGASSRAQRYTDCRAIGGAADLFWIGWMGMMSVSERGCGWAMSKACRALVCMSMSVCRCLSRVQLRGYAILESLKSVLVPPNLAMPCPSVMGGAHPFALPCVVRRSCFIASAAG